MTELLGRVPTIPIPIFNGIQKFRLAFSSIQVFIQMILGHSSDLILKNLVKGQIELANATTMLKQTNLAAGPNNPHTNFQWHTKISTCFQFNSSVYSDDDLYRLVLDPEGQGHQWKMISTQLGSYFGAPPKK